MVTIFTAAATWGAAIFVSLIGLILVLLLLPGGKGYPTRKKTAQLVGLSPEEAREHMAEKLRRIGCDLAPTDSPASLLATRRFIPKREEGALVNTHADRALRVDVEFARYGASTLARTSVRINEFILLDSGEARYAQGLLDWLTDTHDESPAPPVPPNISAEALAAFSNAVTSLAAWALPFHFNLHSHLPPDNRQFVMAGFAIGLGMTAIASIIGARAAFRAVELRPGALRGRPIAALSILLSLATLTVSAAVLLLHLQNHGFSGGHYR